MAVFAEHSEDRCEARRRVSIAS
eukprot:COSAG06_NODE_61287_length_268_cov_0.615385_1_plen_22_part_01